MKVEIAVMKNFFLPSAIQVKTDRNIQVLKYGKTFLHKSRNRHLGRLKNNSLQIDILLNSYETFLH